MYVVCGNVVSDAVAVCSCPVTPGVTEVPAVDGDVCFAVLGVVDVAVVSVFGSALI